MEDCVDEEGELSQGRGYLSVDDEELQGAGLGDEFGLAGEDTDQ